MLHTVCVDTSFPLKRPLKPSGSATQALIKQYDMRLV